MGQRSQPSRRILQEPQGPGQYAYASVFEVPASRASRLYEQSPEQLALPGRQEEGARADACELQACMSHRADAMSRVCPVRCKAAKRLGRKAQCFQMLLCWGCKRGCLEFSMLQQCADT